MSDSIDKNSIEYRLDRIENDISYIKFDIRKLLEIYDPRNIERSVNNIQSGMNEMQYTINDNMKKLNQLINEQKGIVNLKRAGIRDNNFKDQILELDPIETKPRLLN